MLVRYAPEGRDSLRVSGVPAPEDGTNLVLRAIDRARASRPIPPLSVHLRKRTPMGAGLGGGSANAAGVLAHLHDLHPDPRGVEGVREDAASLGSDIPFFLFDHPAAIGTGRGETLSPLRGPLFGGAPVDDRIAAEVPVALTYNRVSHVVMMATPADLEDFAIGFSMTEGLVGAPGDILGLRIVPREGGVEVAMTIGEDWFDRLATQRRNMAGRTGCGLCGAENIEQALRRPAAVARTVGVRHSAL